MVDTYVLKKLPFEFENGREIHFELKIYEKKKIRVKLKLFLSNALDLDFLSVHYNNAVYWNGYWAKISYHFWSYMSIKTTQETFPVLGFNFKIFPRYFRTPCIPHYCTFIMFIISVCLYIFFTFSSVKSKHWNW